MTLYELLGVKKNASVKNIRAAYRKLSKKAHPDTGGSVEAFAELKKAHDILTDEERRAKYDATGDVSEKAPDNALSHVIQILAMVMENVISQIENRMGEPTEFDIVNDMKILLGGQLDNIQTARRDLERKRDKAKKLLGRFGVSKGDNYLENIVAAKIENLEQGILAKEKEIEPVKKALDILVNSSFKSDYGSKKENHQYGGSAPSAYRIADLMNKAMSW